MNQSNTHPWYPLLCPLLPSLICRQPRQSPPSPLSPFLTLRPVGFILWPRESNQGLLCDCKSGTVGSLVAFHQQWWPPPLQNPSAWRERLKELPLIYPTLWQAQWGQPQLLWNHGPQGCVLPRRQHFKVLLPVVCLVLKSFPSRLSPWFLCPQEVLWSWTVMTPNLNTWSGRSLYSWLSLHWEASSRRVEQGLWLYRKVFNLHFKNTKQHPCH